MENSSNVTILDLANHLGMSRNTVSKALNGKHVPDRTREQVLEAAIKLGYKGHDLSANFKKDFKNRKILLLSSRMLMDINFFIFFMRGIESELKNNNMDLLQYTMSNPSSFNSLEVYIDKFQVDGIICLESFDRNALEKIISLNLPTVFMDFIVDSIYHENKYDIILMESFEIIRDACAGMIHRKNCKSFGFVGDYLHCRSFYDRFLGMREALFLNNLEYNHRLSICESDFFSYGNPKEILRMLKEFPSLPDCFVCANDFIAISLMSALSELKVDIPGSVKIIGFDNITETRALSPSLSTVSVNKKHLGQKAVSTLLERISDPSQKKRIIYIESRFVERETT